MAGTYQILDCVFESLIRIQNHLSLCASELLRKSQAKTRTKLEGWKAEDEMTIRGYACLWQVALCDTLIHQSLQRLKRGGMFLSSAEIFVVKLQI